MSVTSTSDLIQSEGLRELLITAVSQVNEIILGKEDRVQLAFTALLAGGHLLIEDLPGTGKTTLAQAISLTIGADYQRIQFTSDMLPADILGVSVYRQDQERFEFHHGPIFAQLVLADELNRATPKTQSALLEAMAEGQVTIEGETYGLPKPFFTIATQNPTDLTGTFPLPDSQLDRFLLSIAMGYPDREAERRLLLQPERQLMLQDLESRMSPLQLAALQQQVTSIHASEALLDYLQSLVATTRDHPLITTGLSPRAGLALLKAARAYALLQHRDFCIPEDIKAVFPALAQHRIQPISATEKSRTDIVTELLHSTAIP